MQQALEIGKGSRTDQTGDQWTPVGRGMWRRDRDRKVFTVAETRATAVVLEWVSIDEEVDR